MVRALTEEEIDLLKKNGNISGSWNSVRVEDPFDPDRIRNSSFSNEVRIGPFSKDFIKADTIVLATGIYNSVVQSSVIGANCAVHNVSMLSGYTLEEEVMLFNVEELTLSENPSFGTGTKDRNGKRNWISVSNENGGRKILSFSSMNTSDCFLWSKYRGNIILMEKLEKLVDRIEDSSGNPAGRIGKGTAVRSCRLLEDIRTGEFAEISGANHLKSLTVNSSEESRTEIGAGSELINGIIGEGSKTLYDVKAHNFVLGAHSKLQYGARFFDSVLGENSTIACCEVQSSLIFPFHEQHHNNSFLIAATLQGQSNIAAGATIGSNHNSRGADGEILAERGFWPALSSSLKHNCRFAAFTLLSKADYPYELSIELPFSLVSQDESEDRLRIMPAYWFMYNMYALARNSWKFGVRDKRKKKDQYIEFDYLAPDTVEEMFKSLELLELWTGKAWHTRYRSFTDYADINALRKKGKEILLSPEGEISSLEVLGENTENSTRKTVILKADKAYRIYREMIHYYAVKNITEYAEERGIPLMEAADILSGGKRSSWVNLGGQLVKKEDMEILIKDIEKDRIPSWDELHSRYINLSKKYHEEKSAHAFASIKSLYNIKQEDMDTSFWNNALEEAVRIQEMIEKNTYESRLKDYTNKYRKITFDSEEEMKAVTGTMEEDTFIGIIKEQTELFKMRVKRLTEEE